MAKNEPPMLSSWAEVDPARYPFDPVEAAAWMRATLAPPAQFDAEAWRDAASVALSDRYGPWAYYWYWSPEGRGPYSWITRFPPPADALAVAVEALLTRRRWLERIAERFDEFLPLLDRAEGQADLAAAWESAITGLMRAAIASVVDDDYWPGRCRRVLDWFLTATGIPVDQAVQLVYGAVDRRFDHWVPPTAADIADVAEQLTRGVLLNAGIEPAAVPGEWPDTWPRNWPTWRATNTTGRDVSEHR